MNSFPSAGICFSEETWGVWHPLSITPWLLRSPQASLHHYWWLLWFLPLKSSFSPQVELPMQPVTDRTGSLGSCVLSSPVSTEKDLSALIEERPVWQVMGLWGRWSQEGDWAPLHTVYTGWRLNSLTISLEICYCSLLKALTEGISTAGWLLC